MEDTKDWISKLFTQTVDGNPDHLAISYVSQEIAKMAAFFKNENVHIIRGMSLFIVIDSMKRDYVCKLIDLVSVEPIP